MDTIINSIGLPIYVEGFEKSFQQYTRANVFNIAIQKSFSNTLPSFSTPKLNKSVTINYVKLYKISDGFRLATTYSDFIQYRDSGTLLTGIEFSINSLSQSNKLYHNGLSFIDTLDSGIYELEIGLSNGSKLESDLFCVDSNNTNSTLYPYILESDGFVMSDNGITPTVWY